MCDFITGSLPKDVNCDRLRPVFEKYAIGFLLLSNKFVLPQLQPGDLYFNATKGHCDCGTVIGMNRKIEILRQRLEEFKKSGRSLPPGKKLPKEFSQPSGLNDPAKMSEAKRWIDFISEVLVSGYTPRIAILKHEYRGDISTEKVKIRRIQHVQLVDLDPELIMGIDDNVLYQFILA